MKFKILPIVLLFLIFIPLSSAVEYPSAVGYINDFADMLSPSDEVRLNNEITAIEKATTVEIAIVTIDSLQGVSIDEYAVKLFEKWGIGKKSKDNGLLILVARNEKEYRIETGYGLEGTINAARAGRIGREIIEPNFKNGEYGKGLYEAVVEIKGLVEDNPDVVAKYEEQGSAATFTGLFAIMIVLAVLAILLAILFYFGKLMERVMREPLEMGSIQDSITNKLTSFRKRLKDVKKMKRKDLIIYTVVLIYGIFVLILFFDIIIYLAIILIVLVIYLTLINKFRALINKFIEKGYEIDSKKLIEEFKKRKLILFGSVAISFIILLYIINTFLINSDVPFETREFVGFLTVSFIFIFVLFIAGTLYEAGNKKKTYEIALIGDAIALIVAYLTHPMFFLIIFIISIFIGSTILFRQFLETDKKKAWGIMLGCILISSIIAYLTQPPLLIVVVFASIIFITIAHADYGRGRGYGWRAGSGGFGGFGGGRSGGGGFKGKW